MKLASLEVESRHEARSTQVRIHNIRIKVRYMGTTDTDTYLHTHIHVYGVCSVSYLCTSKSTSLQLMTEPLFCVQLYTVL